MSVEIELTNKEIYTAAHIGVMRQVQNLQKGRDNTRGLPSDKHCRDWQIHIEGCCAEMAYAQYANLYWSGGELGDVDFPPTTQIKMSQDPESPLWVQKDDKFDPPDHLFILVTGLNGFYTIHGSIIGREAKQTKWWKQCAPGRNWAFGVPQDKLSDF